MGRIEELEKRVEDLEIRLLKNEKIRSVLMQRVEKSINSSGDAYALFEDNITLHQKVEQRTSELEALNRNLRDEISRRREAEEEKEKLINELQKALAEIKVLSGMLPICSYCKKIRNDGGYWQKIEDYIEEHSNAEFTHSLCNDCLKKYYPEAYEALKKEGKISNAVPASPSAKTPEGRI